MLRPAPAPAPAAAADPEALTAEEALRRGTDFLRTLGVEAARLEMELLLARALGINRLGLYLNLQRRMTREERETSRQMLARRREREPISYILGAKEFCGLSFAVTPDVLIPRPETEHLVDRAVEIAQELAGIPAAAGGGEIENENEKDNEKEGEREKEGGRVGESAGEPIEILCIDVGTGSGAIAVAAAARMKAAGCAARWIATDVSEAALAVARQNAEAHAVADQIEFRAGDLLAPLAEAGDLICANLPYVPDADRAALAPEVARWEPAGALFSGAEGLDHIARLIGDAAGRLKPGGTLLLEFGFGQRERVAAMLEAAGAFEAIGFHADLAGIPRVAEARLRK